MNSGNNSGKNCLDFCQVDKQQFFAILFVVVFYDPYEGFTVSMSLLGKDFLTEMTNRHNQSLNLTCVHVCGVITGRSRDTLVNH